MSTNAPDSQLITCGELAVRLRVQPATVRRWSRDGIIPTVRIRAKVLRFDATEVMRALRRRDDDEVGESEEAQEDVTP